MENSNSFLLNIHRDDRQAIGSPYSQQHSWGVREQTIACELLMGNLVDAMNKIRVDLPQRDQRPRLAILHESKFVEKGGAIALHRIARILVGKPEVERVSTVNS